MLRKRIERLTTALLELKEENLSRRENNSVKVLRVLMRALVSKFSAVTNHKSGARSPPSWVLPVLFPKAGHLLPERRLGKLS